MPDTTNPSLASYAVETVDFSPFLRGDSDAKISTANSILQSFKTVGFVCLTNHGLPQVQVDEMFEWSKRFFALPIEKKMLAPHPPKGTHHRGYSAPGREIVTQGAYDEATAKAARLVSQDCKESFESGREDDTVMPNIWLPEEVLPGFRQANLNFYWTCYDLEKSILRALAVGLGLDEQYFIPFHSKADSQLRLLRYPATQIREKSGGPARLSAHTDFDTITLLFQDDVGGLEVEDPTKPGSFIVGALPAHSRVLSLISGDGYNLKPIVPVPNSVVVNAGDFLARWSNDIIKSTLHRVRAPLHAAVDGVVPERYSIPYFCACDLDLIVDAIPGTWSEENPKKYEPTSVMDYVMMRLASAYEDDENKEGSVQK